MGQERELYHACREGDEDLVRQLIPVVLGKKPNFSQSNDINELKFGATNDSFLHAASLAGKVDAVALLCEHGADVSVVNALTYTPLHWASLGGHHKVIAKLLSHGAQVNAVCGRGQTPLHMACTGGHMDSVSTLLKYGAPMTSNFHGQTPLDIALRLDCKTMADTLLEGKDFVEVIGNIATLSEAVTNGRVTFVRCLLSHTHSPFWRFALLVKAQSNRFSVDGVKNLVMITKRILEEDGDLLPLGIHSLFHAACFFGHGNIASLLIYHGADVNATTFGYTPLYTACMYCSFLGVIELLLKRGADVNAESSNKGMALHLAAYNGHLRVASLLLHYGADVNARESCSGYTPLHVACQRGHADVVVLLLSWGVNVLVKDNSGQTAIDVARSQHLEAVMKEIAQHG